LPNSIAVWGDSITVPVAANLRFWSRRDLFDGSGVAETSTQVSQRMLSDAQKHAWITVIWCGHNNPQEPARVRQDIAGMVASLAPGNSRFVIVSLMNRDNADFRKGGSLYPYILQINTELAALFPDNFLDIRHPLIEMYNPSDPVEVQDHADDVYPTHLRYDDIHFDQQGSSMVARTIWEFIFARGW
jgi:hypothetical protein